VSEYEINQDEIASGREGKCVFESKDVEGPPKASAETRVLKTFRPRTSERFNPREAQNSGISPNESSLKWNKTILESAMWWKAFVG
jgi:hypothetical protein